MHTFQYVHVQGTTKGEENGEGRACIYRVNEPSRNADHFFGHSNTSLLLAMSLSKWQKTTHEVDEVICLSCHFTEFSWRHKNGCTEFQQHWKPGLSNNGLPDTGKNVSNHHTDGAGLTH